MFGKYLQNECVLVFTNDWTRHRNVNKSKIAWFRLVVMELAEHIHHMKNCDNYFKVFLTNILFLIQFCFASQRLALAVWERSPGVPHCWLSSLGNNNWKHHGNWRRKRSIVDLRERLQRLVGFSWSMLLFIWQQELSLEGAGVFLSIWSQGNQQLCVFFFSTAILEKNKRIIKS